MKAETVPRPECDHVVVQSNHGRVFHDVYITQELGLRELLIFVCTPREQQVRPGIYWLRLSEGESYDPEKLAIEIVRHYWTALTDDVANVEDVNMDDELPPSVRRVVAQDMDHYIMTQGADLYSEPLFEPEDPYIDTGPIDEEP